MRWLLALGSGAILVFTVLAVGGLVKHGTDSASAVLCAVLFLGFVMSLGMVHVVELLQEISMKLGRRESGREEAQ